MSETRQSEKLGELEEALKKFIKEKEIDVLRIFNSLRYNSDLIF